MSPDETHDATAAGAAGAAGRPVFRWMDGAVRPADELRIPVFDRTLLYGLGAFETVRLWSGRAYLLERHLERLEHSLAAVELPLPACVPGLPEGLAELAERNGTPDALARITVTAGPEGAGADGMHVVVGLRAPPRRPPAGTVRVGLTNFTHHVRTPLAGIKSTSYLVHYLLREQAEAAGRVDDLLLDESGHVTEATVSNVFLVRGGELLTPPLSEGILAGVTRGRLLELAGGLGLRVREDPVPRAVLDEVDECFLTGAGKGLLPVDVLLERTLPVERPVSDALAAAHVADITARCGLPAEAVRF